MNGEKRERKERCPNARVRCLKLAYLEKTQVLDAKREVARRFGIITNCVFCEHCNKYHLTSETWPPARRWRDILVLVARGFRCREIARTLGMSEVSVSWAIGEMLADWHALSQAHLIAIVTSFGIIEPEEFLLLDEELARFRPYDGTRVEYSDIV